MSETRSSPVICRCHSAGCNQQRFRDKDGNWTAGAVVSATTRVNHIRVDNQIAARFLGAQDSDEDSNDDRDHNSNPANPGTPDESSYNVSESNINQLSINQLTLSRADVYDCSPYHRFSLRHSDPAVLHMSLITAMLSVFSHTSSKTSSWLMKSAKGLMTLTASGGLGDSKYKPLNFRQENTLDTLPFDIRTLVKQFRLDPKLVKVICCRSCFAMYPMPAADKKKPDPADKITPTPNAPQIPKGPMTCINKVFPKEADANAKDLLEAASPCEADLHRRGKTDYRPLKTYAYQNLYDWIARLFSRPGIEVALEKIATLAQDPFDPAHEATDIHHSKMWKQFLGPDGTQYTKNSDNLTFGVFMDGINPYGNKTSGKHASITFMIMVCYSLPLDLRYQPENVFVVGIAPGPHEPSLEQINWMLRPIVEQLKVLWATGLVLSETYLEPRGRCIRAAILPFFADLPALRRALGFPGPTSNLMCSYCLLTKDQITNLKRETWPPRNLADHKEWAIKSRDAPNLKTRREILNDHGVRYSVLLELPYWDILNYQVVDSMHNLLLGLLRWHCQRFWCMSDVADEAEPKQTPDYEFLGVWADVTDPILSALRPPSPSPSSTSSTSSDDSADVPFNEMKFRSIESSDDNSFSPFIEAEGWGSGPWTTPSAGKIIFDKDALAFINKLLPRIRIPTWIERALPVLGKASFGSLKADEWRNLFTVQLPLILPVHWASGGPAARSLFRNFAHLVSMVILALKRSMTSERVEKYRHHTLEYLASCLLLFPDETLAPNHHMAIHLADCLDKFGPSRGWWSFSMERLMGKILKAGHNNHLGQLEITFLNKFCRLGNLQVLLSTPEKFPEQLKPFLPQLRAIRDPITVEAETIPKYRQAFLDSTTLEALIRRLNELFPCSTGAPWIPSDKWAEKRKAKSSKFLPVTPRIEKLSSCSINNVSFSTLRENPNNCVIALKAGCAPHYGIIEDIFQHWRTMGNGTSRSDTWLVIQPLMPCNFSNPFAGIPNSKFELQLELRMLRTETLYVKHTQEVLAHCAWIKYKAGEILPSIKQDCIALVTLDR